MFLWLIRETFNKTFNTISFELSEWHWCEVQAFHSVWDISDKTRRGEAISSRVCMYVLKCFYSSSCPPHIRFVNLDHMVDQYSIRVKGLQLFWITASRESVWDFLHVHDRVCSSQLGWMLLVVVYRNGAGSCWFKLNVRCAACFSSGW